MPKVQLGAGGGSLAVLYVAGYFMQQDQASVEVTDVLLSRKLQRHFEDTIVFPRLELKHELLLRCAARFAFVLLHSCV